MASIPFRGWAGRADKSMGAPSPVLHPPFNIVRASHAALAVRDLAASRAFYADTLGLQAVCEGDGAVHLRAMEERGHHCVSLTESAEARADALGFKVFEESDLDRAEQYFAGRGLSPEWVSRPFMGRVLRVRDPWGVPLEFYAKMERLPPIHQRYDLCKGARPLRIDHFNMFSPDVAGAADFYNQLGFRMTEYTEDQESGRLWAAWMHRKGNVHDLALTNGFGPRLHHAAFWTASPMNIIDLLDLMSVTGYVKNIERGPGRHGISNAFFLYVRDPDGHRIEIYCSDYQTADPDHEPIKWDLSDPRRQTLWGAPAPRSWFEEGSLFAGVAPVKSNLKAKPIVAP